MSAAGEFTIRELRAGDLPLLDATLNDWIPAGWQGGADASAHRLRVLVQHVDGVEMPAGIAEYQQIVDEGHLLGIALVPALRGHGFGMRLLQAVLGEMRSSGCTRCLLEVRRSNAAARALYEHAGFLFDGLRKDYYPPHHQHAQQREDALLYSLPL